MWEVGWGGARSFNSCINDQAVFVTKRIIVPIPSARRTFDPFRLCMHAPPRLLQVSACAAPGLVGPDQR